MDEQKVREAIEVFQGHVKWLKCIDDKGCEEACRCCIEYFETAIEALEKQILKKPIKHEAKFAPIYECPSCGYIDVYGQEHCDNCGQKLDWSE